MGTPEDQLAGAYGGSDDQEDVSFSDDGVDLTLIRWMLSLSPAERLEVLQGFVRSLFELRHEEADS